MARAELHTAANFAANPRGRARIACVLCGALPELNAVFSGCQRCGVRAPLELVFALPAHSRLPLADAVAYARQRLLPLAADNRADLGAVTTPLTPATRLGGGVYLKNETFSPTGSHKDRYHAVAAGSARLLGCGGIVTTSTGNHGVSAAAYAASVNLHAVVFCHLDAPEGLLRTIQAFGGIAAQLPPEEVWAVVTDLVARGWFPATSMDPELSGAANPYGAEGYKEIAYEVVEQLGRMPATVVVPTAGGDTVYGICKGLIEIATLAGLALPKVVAVQPRRANSLSRSIAAGRPVTFEPLDTIALSLADRRVGRQAMVALQRTHGLVVDVEEHEITAAVADLAGFGLWMEPASGAGLAGYFAAVRDQLIDASGPAVVVLTASGFKWPRAMARVVHVDPVRSEVELSRRLDLLTGANGLVDGHQ